MKEPTLSNFNHYTPASVGCSGWHGIDYDDWGFEPFRCDRTLDSHAAKMLIYRGEYQGWKLHKEDGELKAYCKSCAKRYHIGETP